MRSFKRIGWFIGLVLIQTLILNKVHVHGYGTPYLYIWLLLTLDTDTGRKSLLLWGFCLGLSVDVFCDTAGMHAVACTFLAFVRPFLLRGQSLREPEGGFEPGARIMGAWGYMRYALAGVCLHAFIIQSLDIFSFREWEHVLVSSAANALSTLLCIGCLNMLRGRG